MPLSPSHRHFASSGTYLPRASDILGLKRPADFHHGLLGSWALSANTTGTNNTAIGYHADVALSNLTNATAIGFNTIVNASNKVRIGNPDVTVVEGPVAYTFTSDRGKKENFRDVDPEDVLNKLQNVPVTSWNYIGNDVQQFRHYGPMAQDFFAAFGKDDMGTIGSPTTLQSGDVDGVLILAIQGLKAENTELKNRLEKLERLLAPSAPSTRD
jgi:hypothetical protein